MVIHFDVSSYDNILQLEAVSTWRPWRACLKVWAYGLNFLGVFTP